MLTIVNKIKTLDSFTGLALTSMLTSANIVLNNYDSSFFYNIKLRDVPASGGKRYDYPVQLKCNCYFTSTLILQNRIPVMLTYDVTNAA